MKPTQTQTTIKTDMDSKEGIEKVTPVDAQVAGLLDPSFLWLGADDAITADLPRERADSPAGSCAGPDETTIKTDMDSKEGIEKVTPVDAQVEGLLDPSFLRLGADDAIMADPPRERADSLAGSNP